MRSWWSAAVQLFVAASLVMAGCARPAAPPPDAPSPAASQTPAAAPSTAVPTALPGLKSRDPQTWTQVEYGEPETLDPALDYESAGSEMLSALYDTLITYNKSAPAEFIPALAVEVPSVANGGISPDGLTYTFKIRAGVKFQDGSDLTPEDVAYTFQRGLLQGGASSPQWLFSEALLGTGVDDIAVAVDPKTPPYDDPTRLATYPADQLRQVCADLTGKTIVADPAARTVTFHLKQPWGAFLAAFAGAWGSITSQAWVSANGGWDGDCADWQKYYGVSPEQSLRTKLGSSAMGTGPFKLDRWTPNQEIVLSANENYWRAQPGWAGGPSGAASLKKIVVKDVEQFSTRLTMLQAGDADTISVNSDQWPIMDKLVGETCDGRTGQCQPSAHPDGPLRAWSGYITGNRVDVFFNFNVNAEGNAFIGSGKLDGKGVPPDFFSDEHIRRAFEYCFDYDTYLKDALQGEGTRSKTVMLPGMLGYDENAPFYSYDPVKCEQEFKASSLKSDDGRSLWETGFRLTAVYNTGNTKRQTIMQILQQTVARVNPKFVIDLTGLPWPAFLRAQRARQLPLYTTGWIMDLYDSHNWLVPYTTGIYGNMQNLPADLKDRFRDLYTRAVVELDPAKSAEIYREFNQLFYDSATCILLFQVNGRHYEPRYVQGWYYNPLLAGDVPWYAVSKK